MSRVGLRTNLLYSAAIIFFVFIVFIPPVYVLSYAFQGKFTIDDTSVSALKLSFKIGAVVTAIDVLFGTPLAWILVKRKMKFRLLVDTLVDMPLVVPTSILGISIFMFWGGGNFITSFFGASNLLSKGPLMMVLLHVVFTFPYVVRSVEAAIHQIDVTHEQAATMLGASPFTVFRTISLPLFRSGLISGAILAFTRSLSETGATMMVAGLSMTAPVLIVGYKNASNISSAAAVSTILICVAVLLLIAAKILSARTRIPIIHVWPNFERTLSRSYVAKRDGVLGIFLLSIILLPTFFIVLSQMSVVRVDTAKTLLGNTEIFRSIVLSFTVGLIVTVVNLAFALPLGMMISKDVLKSGAVLDTLNDVILLIPTSALGLSLNLFWGNFHANEFLILALAHMSFTFPLMVKPISTAISGVDENLHEAARTLGARPFRVFRTITYPLIKPGIIAGVIMTFMRSLSETGATMGVSKNIKTIPVLLVDLFNNKQLTDDAILACIILFAISFAFILFLKMTTTREKCRK